MSSRNQNNNSDLMGLDTVSTNENKPSLSNTTSNSHMGRMSMKTKVTPKPQNKFINPTTDSKKHSKQTSSKPIRKDNFGTIINKQHRKTVRISFIDEISDEPLVTVIDIKSIKELNRCSTIGATKAGKDVYVKETSCCSCVLM